MELKRIRPNDIIMINKVFLSVRDLEEEYPNFKNWFYQIVVPGLVDGTRSIIAVVCHNEIAAILILKNSDEKKICTLRVSEKYRNLGIGSKLLKVAFKELQTSMPIITVSDKHKHEFENVLEKNGFVLEKAYPNYYLNGVIEYSYNGLLNEVHEEECCG